MKKVILVFITSWFVLCSSNISGEYHDISDQCIFKVDIGGGACFQVYHNSTLDEVIIKNELDYQDFMNSTRNRNSKGCMTAPLPHFNFGKYIIVGKKTSGMCRNTSNYLVSVDYKNRKLKYTIDVEYSGNCYSKVMSWNFACIPKVFDYYSIDIEAVER